MRRNGFGAGSFLLGILVGIVLLILIAFAVSSNSTIQFNEPNGSAQSTGQPTTAPGQLPREKSSPPEATVTFNARAEWNQFIAELASIPQAIVNWVRSLGGGPETSPVIVIATPTP
jgi:hypothetical protein